MEIKIVKKNDNIVQITTLDERWYREESIDPLTGQSLDKFYPSSTWIASYYPKGIGFYKWLADKGWDEAQAIKNTAGDKGSKVHNAIADLLMKKEVKMDDKYFNDSLKTDEELTEEEWYCLMTFAAWYKEFQPDQLLALEKSFINKRLGFGGTVDMICLKDNVLWVIDFKTSQNIWKEHELQISSYKHSLPYLLGPMKKKTEVKMATLQIGYSRNKNGYKFTEVEDKIDLFLGAYKVWNEEVSQKEPKQRDYPYLLKLVDEPKVKVEKVKKINKKTKNKKTCPKHTHLAVKPKSTNQKAHSNSKKAGIVSESCPKQLNLGGNTTESPR